MQGIVLLCFIIIIKIIIIKIVILYVYQTIVITIVYSNLVMVFLHSVVQPYTSGTSSCGYPGCKDWVVYSPKWRRFPLHIRKYLSELYLRGTAVAEIYTGMRCILTSKFYNIYICVYIQYIHTPVYPCMYAEYL